MKNLLLLACVLLSGCGGAGESGDPAPTGPIVFIGDSITELWEYGNPPVYPVAAPTLDERLPGAIDVGISGQTTAQMLARFQTDVLSHNPAVVVILGGTNDLRLIQDATIDDIATMADEAATAGARVIIGTVPLGELWTDSTFLTEAETAPAIQAWNAQLHALACAHGYELADYYTAMLNPGVTQDLSLFNPDGIHPDSAGYAVMWGVLAPALAKDGIWIPPQP